ncbi:MAG: HDIG domain-containing protein [Ardenticatenales bacterium]|nr:HDIG domain-containing protein [Ardenticatenales bacterium]
MMMTGQAEIIPDAGTRMTRMVQSSLLWLVTIGLTVGLAGIMALNLVTGPQVSVVVGEPAARDIIASQSITFESALATQRQKDNAAASVGTIYSTPDLSIGRAGREQAQVIFNFVDVVRADGVTDAGTRARYLHAIETITIEPQIAVDILTFTPAEFSAVKDDILRIVEEVMRQEIRETGVSEARRTARSQISFYLTTPQERVVTSLAPQFIVANTFPDESATEQKRNEAIAAVEPVLHSATKGERIIRVGEIVDAEDVEMLEQLGLLRQHTDWAQIVSVVTAAVLAVTVIIVYWQVFERQRMPSNRYLLIFAFLILIFTLGAKLMVPGRTALSYLFPAAALSMLVAVIFDVRLSILVTIVEAALVGYIAGNSLELTAYYAVGSLIAVLTLRDVQRINAFFRAGLIAAVANMAVIVVFRLPQDPQPVEFFQLLGWALANGLITASLSVAGLFFMGSVFGIITTLQLQELSRLDHPLLQELLRRAPGTYHHSIMVANLAEQAAELVAASGTLVRVGAFYHDVGKINRPPFFTENQAGLNPHENLDPYSSARIIMSHVADGLALARQYRLPDRIRDFIAEHHGDNLVIAFYKKAQEEAEISGEEVDSGRFRYPGPRPRSRETGIVMLADSVEAASSALRPDTEAEIERLVNSIVEGHLKAGQLDNSGLTLGELQHIRSSFIKTLKGRFHVRVRYPGNEEMMRQPMDAGISPEPHRPEPVPSQPAVEPRP